MLLITEGADVNIPDSDGDTPLVSAMDNQMWDVSELLIQKDADIQIKSKNLAWYVYL
jgi:ankyrin repeat protein|tara:strand:+ start:1072 stop:1242 length:171 start_codon:yes stop_codon:yes gene_type:complete